MSGEHRHKLRERLADDSLCVRHLFLCSFSILAAHYDKKCEAVLGPLYISFNCAINSSISTFLLLTLKPAVKSNIVMRVELA